LRLYVDLGRRNHLIVASGSRKLAEWAISSTY
jgi:hypothetical protein